MSRRSARGATATPLVEKVSASFPKHSVLCDIESALNAISTNSNGSHVVVAGRNVFKILSINETGFVDHQNLRVGRVNLNFSHTDVQWNPNNDNMMATAATNGAVVLWDLERQSKNKQEHVFTDHNRTVNKVCFHSDGHSLFSGSQDGTIRSFDLRQRNSKNTFDCKTESVRDIQVSPHMPYHFAAALENGCVQIWDMRNPAQYESNITAHQGPVFTCDWHPSERHWLATAGRDKIIKVWDMRERLDVHSLHTIASVARIKWRPERPYELASCALLLDFNIHVWDIRRPYIPSASFPDHKDVTTGVVWLKDPSYLLSGAKDNFLCLHHIDDALRPVESAPPLGLALGCRGQVSFAVSDEIKRTLLKLPPAPPPLNQLPSHTQPAFFRQAPPGRHVAPSVSSDLMMFLRQQPQTVEAVTELDWVDIFCVLAKGYKLGGLPLPQLFEHNMELALRCNCQQEAQTWSVLNLLYAPISSSGNGQLAVQVPNPEVSSVGRSTAATPDVSSLSGIVGASATQLSVVTDDIALSDDIHNAPGSNSSHSDCESNGSDLMSEVPANIDDYDELNHIARGGYHDENDDVGYGFDDTIGGEDAMQNLVLPSEAFQPRYQLDPGSPASLSDDELRESTDRLAPSQLSATSQQRKKTPTLSALGREQQYAKPWDFSTVVSDLLHFYSHQGNVQMTVSVLLVLGEKGKALVDEDLQEQWYLAYIDLLARFQLWSVSASVIKLCPLKAVSMLNLDSTTVATQCGRCNKSLMSKGSYCDRCRQLTNLCSFCHQRVQGLFVWCQGCGHGGHIDHMRSWFKKCSWCPAGCGHKCEFM